MTLTIELCKRYKTRGGWKAVPVERHEDGRWQVWHEGTRGDCTHGSDGAYGADREYAHDLIEPWVEPEKVEWWINVFGEHGAGQSHITREDAEHQYRNSCTHLYHFTGTLGEALTGECVWSKDGGEQ